MKALKHMALAAVAMSALIGGQTVADASAGAGTQMGGTAEPTCTLNPVTQVGVTNASLASGFSLSAATFNITTLTSASTALFQAGSANPLCMSRMRKYSHNISLQISQCRLKPTAAQLLANSEVAGFLPFIKHGNYNAIATRGGPIPMALSTSSVAGAKATANVAGKITGTGQFSLSLSNPAGFPNRPMIARTWSDRATVQIGAALYHREI